MGYVNLISLKSSRLAQIRRILFLIFISVTLLLATLGISAHHKAINRISTNTKPTFKMQIFAHKDWYPLIKDYQVKDSVMTVYTIIYPDDDGKKLAQCIANEIYQSESLPVTVKVFGLDNNPYLLATSNNYT